MAGTLILVPNFGFPALWSLCSGSSPLQLNTSGALVLWDEQVESYYMKSFISQMSIPCSNYQALRQPMPLWEILKGRSSGQEVLAVSMALPKNPPTSCGCGAAGHKQQGLCLAHQNLLPSPSLYCLQPDRPINRKTSCWDEE